MNTPSLPFDRNSLVLSWYGSRYALGGHPDVLRRIANIISNFDDAPAQVREPEPIASEYADDPTVDRSPSYITVHRRTLEVHETHKTFGYIVGEEADFVKAFTLLRRLAIPHTGKRGDLRRASLLARKLGRNDFLAVKRENFLLGQDQRNATFAARIEEGAQSVQTVDGDRDWQADVFERAAERALRETMKAA